MTRPPESVKDQQARSQPSAVQGPLLSNETTSMSPIVGPLLGWFATDARALPWREAGIGAWAVLVSEIMLQQTPVARVIPSYLAWLSRWPTPAALAADSPGEAVRMWGKLGYPRRALRLHSCAVIVTEQHGGEIPRALPELLALPGVGAYTARAVLAFAYGQRAAVVDTNVRRVLARALSAAERPGPVSTTRDLEAMQAVLPEQDATAAQFCAAIMELGALRCTAVAPKCQGCPIATHCRWRLAGYPPHEGPQVATQRFTGTDRQVRGRLLDVLRASPVPVRRSALDIAWPLPVQRERALTSLLRDGLVELQADGMVALPS